MKIVEWNEYSELLKEVYEELKFKHFTDIVTIGRGGSVIGAYLASKLGTPTFLPVFLRHVEKEGETRIEGISPDVRDQIESLTGNLLIVDDYLRDGLAIKYVLDLIPEAASVDTLVLYSNKGSDFKPDIVGKYIEETTVSFPYDVLG